ncbi:MAG: hypothetical protein Q8L55_03955 [Phycisphaerales bacterium]|nr:hypothetical protein [Phycisphaerales bacterium]
MPPRNTNYMPRPDGDFESWIANFLPAVDDFWTEQGLDKNDLDALKDAAAVWQSAYPSHVAAQAAAESAAAAKRAARAALEAQVRPITNFVQSFSATTDADRAELGISIRDTSRTPVPPPATAPAVSVAAAGRLTHQLRLTDSATPTRRGKPRGTTGAEVWFALTTPGLPAPQDPAAYRFLALTTKTTLRTDFKPAEGGKTASYMLRWVNTRGEVGPWSEVATGTVAA